MKKNIFHPFALIAAITICTIYFGFYGQNGNTEATASDPGAESSGLAVGLVEGTHYTVFEPFDPNMPDVSVVFWYGCPHCQAFRSPIKEFAERNPNLIVKHRHSFMNERWLQDALFFYSAMQLENPNEISDAYFDAREKTASHLDATQVAGVLETLGISINDLKNKISSAVLLNNLEETSEFERHYQIKGVPAVIAAGKYRLENGAFSSQEDMLRAAESLIKADQASLTKDN
jgi:thiol:disulfide interchange protein DsbA